ncbi:hypothetical protein IE53DRAFT_17111 [Violaceomyces palustris]|uniref:Uncharacterized protein n=1 Tax=Violaceomyces palustris TaxID=1673888 RepID=A0ACD0P1V7_9BASI|nr:hypothetical protein IE53DRAFT_17111 [Violaceomyces palustris]
MHPWELFNRAPAFPFFLVFSHFLFLDLAFLSSILLLRAASCSPSSTLPTEKKKVEGDFSRVNAPSTLSTPFAAGRSSLLGLNRVPIDDSRSLAFFFFFFGPFVIIFLGPGWCFWNRVGHSLPYFRWRAVEGPTKVKTIRPNWCPSGNPIQIKGNKNEEDDL